MPSISLCVIAKNEESCIQECLLSVNDLVDEMIVIDTGSTDRTVEIATTCGAKVYHFPWNGSFSDARNESLKYATKEWILVLDADEIISPQDHQQIQKMIENSTADGFMLLQRNYTNDASRLRWEPCDKRYVESKDFYGFVPCPVCRLFRNRPEYRYRYKIHEMVNEAIIDHHGTIKMTTVPIHHYKAFKTKEETMQKADKYLDLLEQQIRESPHDPKTYYEYGQLLLNLKRPKEAVAAFQNVAKLEQYADHAYSKIGFLHYLLAKACLQCGVYDQAIAWLQEGIQINPNGKECYLLLATTLLSKNKVRDALSVIETALTNHIEDIAVYNTLGVIYMQLRLFPDAIHALLRGKQMNAGINPVIEKINNNLFACYLQIGNDNDAVQLLESAIEEAPKIASYYANLAQWYGRNGKFQEAREKLEKIKEIHPEKADYIQQKLQELTAIEQAIVKQTKE